MNGKNDVDEPVDKDRRNFFKFLGVAAIAAGGIGALRGVLENVSPPITAAFSSFPTLLLYSQSGKPIGTSDLKVNNSTIVLFDYPLQNEPNFLLRLGDSSNNDQAIEPTTVKILATGKTFTSAGGVGPYKSVVASSAICQHLGCIPPIIHFYPPSSPSYPGKIHCNCHGSTYDPYKGFAVVTGPTTHPLPNTVLTYDSSKDQYSVTSLVGPTIYGHSSDLSGGSQLPSSTYTEITTLTPTS
ncbi:MAG: Rieske 2Fe-2S domain-containing protein [Candidatus Thermoplasmatota archaeon]|jgi:Rieske Fe-S protein|nr:Rieske 2Fe-2S domain-containing protein [Candidatus Thermoplasmatota archaeon]MCL5882160.1 Rieske 2Fe-2S domain-containing protein [Candidatus Thermoplasmatota archaeon]